MSVTHDGLRGAVQKAPSGSLVEQLNDRSATEIAAMASFWGVKKNELYNTLTDTNNLYDYFENKVDKHYKYRCYRVVELLVKNENGFDFNLMPKSLCEHGLLCKYYYEGILTYNISNEVKVAWMQMPEPRFIVDVAKNYLVVKYIENSVFYFGIRSIIDIYKQFREENNYDIDESEFVKIAQEKIASDELSCTLRGLLVCDNDFDNDDFDKIIKYQVDRERLPIIKVTKKAMVADHYTDYEEKVTKLCSWMRKNGVIDADAFAYRIFYTIAKRNIDYNCKFSLEMKMHKQMYLLLNLQNEMYRYAQILSYDIPCWELNGFSKEQLNRLMLCLKKYPRTGMRRVKRKKPPTYLISNRDALESRYGF